MPSIITSSDAVMHNLKRHGIAAACLTRFGNRQANQLWLDWINTQETKAPGSGYNLLSRAYRPFLRHWMGLNERVRLLIQHHNTMDDQLGALQTSLKQPSGLLICKLEGKSGKTYSLSLQHARTKEGELSLILTDDASAEHRSGNTHLAIMRLTLDKEALWVGSLQGAKPPMGRNEIVAATRDLGGLRPKHAVLQAAATLAAYLGLERMLAPGVYNHISQRQWRRYIGRKITAEYDVFWTNFTNTCDDNGDYSIPVPLPVRSIEDVPQKKRSEWRKRHAHTEYIKQAFMQILLQQTENNCT